MSVDETAPSMILVNTVTGDSRTPQFNPAEFSEQISVNYAKLQVVGLSHTRKHYINTEDVKFGIELFYHCVDGSGPAGLKAILDDRKFLYAMTHPWRAGSIRSGGTPRVLFIWPGFISLTCVMTNLAFQYTLFNKQNMPIAYKATVQLEEIRDVFVSMEDILAFGTLRAGPDGVVDMGDV